MSGRKLTANGDVASDWQRGHVARLYRRSASDGPESVPSDVE